METPWFSSMLRVSSKFLEVWCFVESVVGIVSDVLTDLPGCGSSKVSQLVVGRDVTSQNMRRLTDDSSAPFWKRSTWSIFQLLLKYSANRHELYQPSTLYSPCITPAEVLDKQNLRRPSRRSKETNIDGIHFGYLFLTRHHNQRLLVSTFLWLCKNLFVQFNSFDSAKKAWITLTAYDSGSHSVMKWNILDCFVIPVFNTLGPSWSSCTSVKSGWCKVESFNLRDRV